MESWEGAQLNEAKEILAFQLTELVHGTEEAKKAQQAKKEEEKKADKKKEEEKKAETIQADSIEDLIAAIKAKLHPEETADTTDTEESTTEQSTTTEE